MSLLKLYNLFEAGVMNKPTREPKKKDQPEAEPDEMDAAVADLEEPDEPEAVPEPEPEAEPETPFASQSVKPSPALQGGKVVGSVKADKMTLEALQTALESVRTRDDDLQDWIDDVIREIGRAIRSGSELNLPKFEATPGLDTFDDDGGGEDEDY